ncbi:MAG: hypothetical protein [Caudoviricetes sp.]|nr:MAG: hypothetical protein [Caudoviricetes sp.]
MKDLNPKEVYDLRGITEEQAILIKEKLGKNNVLWHKSNRCIEYLMTDDYLINNNGNWYHGSADNYPTTHISTLFEEKSLEEQLNDTLKLADELKKQIEDRYNPKVGDVVKVWDEQNTMKALGKYRGHDGYYRIDGLSYGFDNIKKLTQQEVIDLLFDN